METRLIFSRPQQSTWVRNNPAVRNERVAPPGLGGHLACRGKLTNKGLSQNSKKLSIEKTPFFPSNHSATNTAPCANPSRLWAVCLISRVSMADWYFITWVPGAGSTRNEFITRLLESEPTCVTHSFFSAEFLMIPSASVMAVPLGESFFWVVMGLVDAGAIFRVLVHHPRQVFVEAKKNINPQTEIRSAKKSTVLSIQYFSTSSFPAYHPVVPQTTGIPASIQRLRLSTAPSG